MKTFTFLSAVAAAACLLALSAHAESSAASSVSDSASSATSSASDSLEGSSNSSSGAKKVAAGEYRVIEVAAADRPGLQRVLLRGADGAELRVRLPVAAAERGQLAVGRQVLVNERPYGWEFAAADTREAFFLVLEDGWHRELQSRPVVL